MPKEYGLDYGPAPRTTPGKVGKKKLKTPAVGNRGGKKITPAPTPTPKLDLEYRYPQRTDAKGLRFLLDALSEDIMMGKTNEEIAIEREPARRRYFPDVHPYAMQVLMGLARSGLPPISRMERAAPQGSMPEIPNIRRRDKERL